jgi:hypothetical protein
VPAVTLRVQERDVLDERAHELGDLLAHLEVRLGVHAGGEAAEDEGAACGSVSSRSRGPEGPGPPSTISPVLNAGSTTPLRARPFGGLNS